MSTLGKWVFTLSSVIFYCTTVYSQASTEMICGKKWYWEMTKDASGEIHQVDSLISTDFMHFLCDSNFVLKEQNIELRGKWSFDGETMTINLYQQQINTMPEHISFHLIDYDEGKLVIMGREGTNEEQTGFLYAK